MDTWYKTTWTRQYQGYRPFSHHKHSLCYPTGDYSPSFSLASPGPFHSLLLNMVKGLLGTGTLGSLGQHSIWPSFYSVHWRISDGNDEHSYIMGACQSVVLLILKPGVLQQVSSRDKHTTLPGKESHRELGGVHWWYKIYNIYKVILHTK